MSLQGTWGDVSYVIRTWLEAPIVKHTSQTRERSPPHAAIGVGVTREPQAQVGFTEGRGRWAWSLPRVRANFPGGRIASHFHLAFEVSLGVL